MSRRRSWTAFGVALAVALGLAWKGEALFPIDGDGPVAQVDVGRAAHRDPSRVRGDGRRDARAVEERPGETRGDEIIQTSDRALADYLESSKYPPMSRPLRDTDRHLVEWNRRHEKPRPTDLDARLGILFTADRYFMIGEEPLSIRFEAIGARIGSLVVTARTLDSAEAPLEIAMEPSGGADGLRGTFLPPDRGVPVRYLLMAAFTTEDGRADSVTFNVEHTSEAATPARFTGAHRSALEEGSLAVYAEVLVREAGSYLFDANLFLEDTPVAWTRFKGSFEPGTTEVRMMFFGKVLADHRAASPNATGTFEVRQLRGARYRENQEPELAQMKPFDGTLDTGIDLAHPFSDSVYESPHKAAKLARLRELADSGRGIDLPATR